MVGNLFHPINRHQEIHLPMTLITYQVVEIRTLTVMYIPEGSIEACQEPKEMKMFDMSPVPITEERLLNFGIDINRGNYWGPLQLVIHNGKYLLVSEDNEYGMNYDEAVEVKYVHHLQNLFFALNGEVLTIKQLTN